MDKKIFFTTVIFLSFFVAKAQQFVLEGEILNSYNGKIYLLYGNKIDSTEVKNQRFSFSGSIGFPVKANLSTSKNNRSTGFFILESGTLSADIVIENKHHVHFRGLSGSKSVEELKNFMIFRSKFQHEPNLNDWIYTRLSDIFRKNPKNQLYGLLLAETLSEKKLSYSQAQSLLHLLDTKTQDPEDMDRVNTLLESLEQTQIGAIFPATEFPNKKNEPLSLQASLKRFTLVSFGSTDCVGCIELDRKMAEVYKEFKSDGFTIYEVFLDNDKETWLAYVEKEKITWNNVIATRKYNNPLIKKLGITALPANFLLDQSGRIIAINIGPASLVKKLKELLGK